MPWDTPRVQMTVPPGLHNEATPRRADRLKSAVDRLPGQKAAARIAKGIICGTEFASGRTTQAAGGIA